MFNKNTRKYYQVAKVIFLFCKVFYIMRQRDQKKLLQLLSKTYSSSKVMENAAQELDERRRAQHLNTLLRGT